MSAAPASEPRQYLTFSLGGEMYAIGILAIKEIIEYSDLSTVPMMPPAVRGVINLRGAVVPVVDLQVRFGGQPAPVTKRTCIVIVETGAEDLADKGEQHVIGLVVDSVSEVLDIAPADIEPAPSFGARIRSDFIQGMGKVRGRFVVLLATDSVLALDEIGALAEAPATADAVAPA
ncbi:chemotaxis protein CheW [Xylophilus sp. GW821-FHT01B05]